MTLLTREQILSALDLKTEQVEVPEWGGSVNVRELNARERNVVETRNINKDFSNISALVLSMAAIDEHGNQLFTEADANALGYRSGVAMSRAFNVILRLSGLDNAPAKVDALEKNSVSSPADSSHCDSQESLAAPTST